MRMSRAIRLMALIAFLCTAMGPAAFASKPGTSTARMLQFGAGARAVGMGEAYTAVARDVYATYWNPAGLGRMSGREAGVMYGQLVENLKYEYGAFAFPLGHGAFGISASYLSYGDIEGFTNNDDRIGNLPTSYDTQASVSYGHRITSRLSAGVSARYIQKRLATRSAHTGAADVGLQYDVFKGFTLAAVVQHLGGTLTFAEDAEHLPRTLKGGAAYQGRWVQLAADAQKPMDQKCFLTTGLEVKPHPLFALRAGYNTGDDVDHGVRVGAGLAIRRDVLLLDYAFLPFGDFGNTHRIGFSYRWARSEK